MQRDDNAFDDRKKSHEAKYKMDEERRFKVRSRRNKLLGAWAAGLLGMEGAEADAFVADVVMMGFEAASDSAFLEKLRARLAESGRTVQIAAIADQLVPLTDEATRQITEQFPTALETDHRQVGDGPYTRNK